MFGFESRLVTTLSPCERKKVDMLLAAHGLSFDSSPDCTVLVEDAAENLVATASLDGSVIKMVAADPQWQEAGLSGTAITRILQFARERGIYHLFVYTKPDMAEKFSHLGFTVLAETQSAVLMESGQPSSGEFVKYLKSERFGESMAPFAAAVMNCNPFTLGHRYLIEMAASACGALYVILVQEDLSEFPFADRIELVRAGTADLKNVKVIASGDYAVSRLTFPTYFLKDRAEEAIAKVQAELDATLFASLFVPALSIVRRFVGEEPFSRVTEIYNEAMKKILPPCGVQLEIIPRREDRSGTPISASRVRDAIRRSDEGLLLELLPETTLGYLRTDRGMKAAERIRAHDAR